MPDNMQEAVIEARAQLQAEAKLKDACRQLNIPIPLTTAPPSVVFPEGTPSGSKTQVSKEMITTQGDFKSAEVEGDMAQATSSAKGPRRIIPTQVKSEGDIKP